MQNTTKAANYIRKLPYACANIQWTERGRGTHVPQNGKQWKTASRPAFRRPSVSCLLSFNRTASGNYCRTESATRVSSQLSLNQWKTL